MCGDKSLRLLRRFESLHPAFSQKIFDIPVAQVEAIVEPDSTGNDTRRESVALVGIDRPILSIPGG
jgi:hypothetical protein